MTVTPREITDDNRAAVLALRTTPAQERFVSSVADSLAEAAVHPEGNPWFRAASPCATPRRRQAALGSSCRLACAA